NAQSWHTVKHPTSGATEIHGSYANGCFSGGITIPIKQNGYEQVRPSRNRHYGTPNMMTFVENIDQFSIQQQRVIISRRYRSTSWWTCKLWSCEPSNGIRYRYLA